MAAPRQSPCKSHKLQLLTSQAAIACCLVPNPGVTAISGQLPASWCSAPHTLIPQKAWLRGRLCLSLLFCLPFPQIFSPQSQKTTCRWASEGRLLLRVHGDGLAWVPGPLLASTVQNTSSSPHPPVGTKLSTLFLLRNDYCPLGRQPCRAMAMAEHGVGVGEGQALPAPANWICWA